MSWEIIYLICKQSAEYIFLEKRKFELQCDPWECLFQSFNVVAAWPHIKCWSTLPRGSVAANNCGHAATLEILFAATQPRH